VLPNLIEPQPGPDIPNLVNNNKSEVKHEESKEKENKKSLPLVIAMQKGVWPR
jgi:hypothetical protein